MRLWKKAEEVIEEWKREQPEPIPLFIDQGNKLVGVVTSAEKVISRSNLNPWIKVHVDCSEGNELVCMMSRMEYTAWVIRAGLGRTPEDEEDNLRQLVNAIVFIDVVHQVDIAGRFYFRFTINQGSFR
jgi:hypothetical protein